MSPSYLTDIISRARSTADAERTDSTREGRDVMLIGLMLEDLDISARYTSSSASELQNIFQQLLLVPQLQRDLIAYYIVLNTSEYATAKDFARSRHLTQAHAARIQGFWHLDNGRVDEAVRLLSTPNPWSGFADDDRIKRLQDAVLEILKREGTPASINKFIQGSGMIRNSPWRRECSVRALALEDGRMREAWRYVRDLEFEDEMILGEELELDEQDEMDVDGDERQVQRKVEMVQDERKRLLAIMLDAILIPRPHKTALRSLVKLPIDNFEHRFMTSYLLNTTSTLSAASFSLLHDLLTLRLCSSGQHANAIDLDRQVTERIRERPELAVASESRANVQAMVELLPEVQRKMLLVERDAVNTEEVSKEQAVEVTRQSNSTHPASAPFTRPSFAPLSASVQLRQASNPRNAIYQALLRSTSSSSITGNAASARAHERRFPPSGHAPASSRRQLNNSTSGMEFSIRVPYGGQQTQFPASPFNLPPRVPVGYAASSAYAPSAGMSGRGDFDDETYDDGSVTPRDARSASPQGGILLQDESMADEREETPVARGSAQRAEQHEEDRREDDLSTSHSGSPSERMDVEEQGGHEVVDKAQPAQTAKAKHSRQEPLKPANSPPATRTIAKTPRRTRGQKQESQPADETEQPGAGEDQAIPIPGAFPTATKAKRKLRSSSHSDNTNGNEETDAQATRAKRTRKGATGAEAARRATRSQSVVSQATTEADHEETARDTQDSGAVKRRPQRRSARLSESTAPSSPARSVASEAASTTATKPRTRKAASTPKKTGPPATRGVRTRRQAAALEEEDEE